MPNQRAWLSWTVILASLAVAAMPAFETQGQTTRSSDRASLRSGTGPPPAMGLDSAMEGAPPALPPALPGRPARVAGALPEHPGPPLALEDAIALALGSSPDLRSAIERVRIADAALARARAEFFPKLSLAEAFVDTNIPALGFFFVLNQRRLSLTQNFNHPGFVNNFSTLLFLQQNLYSGGRRQAEAGSAAEREIAAKYALDVVRNEMVYQVAEAFYRLVQARDQLESRQHAVRQVEHHLELARARFRAGTAVRSDVLSLEVRVAEVKEGEIMAANQVELGWALLENVMGQAAPTRVLPPEIPNAPWSARIEAVETAITEAVLGRAELGESQSRQRAAAHDLEAAHAGKRPTVDFLANYSTFDINSTSGGNGIFVGVLAQINLFDGHRTRAQVEQARARLRELQASHQRLLLDTELEVRQAYLQLRSAEARLAVARQAIALAEKSLGEVESRYRAQAATLTRLIDAQVALTDSRIRRANAAADVAIARAALERAVGHFSHILTP